jgi:hypothetical protein
MRFTQYIGTPVTAERALQIAELLILKCGHMKTEYSMWKTLLPQDRTFTNFCNWWKEKYAIWKTTHQAASSFGYGGSATQVDEEIDTINAATNAANAATFQQLTQSNNALAQQLQALQLTNAQLVQQVAAAAQAPVMPTPITYQPPQPIVQPTPPQQYVQPPQYMAPKQVQQQPYQQQYQPQQYGGRGGGRGYGRSYGRGNSGRGGGRGYGRGGGRGYGRGGYNYNNGYQQSNYNQNQGGGFYDNVNQSKNPIKRHNNMWYCWTHGFDVDHHSGNCAAPKPGHQWNATRTNTMGGCQAKIHKTVLPSGDMNGANSMYYM